MGMAMETVRTMTSLRGPGLLRMPNQEVSKCDTICLLTPTAYPRRRAVSASAAGDPQTCTGALSLLSRSILRSSAYSAREREQWRGMKRHNMKVWEAGDQAEWFCGVDRRLAGGAEMYDRHAAKIATKCMCGSITCTALCRTTIVKR